ncbi:MAG: bifunctional 4-hydroxy-2-oxoglutarate aldolase/2-dehydro-3-deoxy-phosphogluconate aldolase [Chloroflexota bacterium]
MMTSSQAVLDTIIQDGAVAGMRGAFPPDVALNVCGVLLEEGIHTFEFTMNSEQPIEGMKAVKAEFGDEVFTGMGTVLDVETAKRVLDAGADFVVSPVFQPDVVQTILDQDILMAPGVATPTEAITAWNMGVKLLKVFPIGALGIDYFKAMFGPLNHMRYMCNGAMTDENARQFIQAGAVAAGMGGWLTGDGSWTDSKLRSRARVLLNAIESARSE